MAMTKVEVSLTDEQLQFLKELNSNNRSEAIRSCIDSCKKGVDFIDDKELEEYIAKRILTVIKEK